MTDDSPDSFWRKEAVDKPAIVGAQWWQTSVVEATPIARRSALNAILGVAGVVALGSAAGAFFAASSSSSSDAPPPEYDVTQVRGSLEMQRTYGWDFGAAGESLVFDGATTQPFDRGALARLDEDVKPARGSLRRFHVTTLAESLSATQKLVPPGDPSSFHPIGAVLKPIFTSEMSDAFRSGKALARLLAAANVTNVAVVADLRGAECVAFAAGAIDAFDPVWLFDNWPHPRGVVASHRVLAAAAWFQPLFAKARQNPRRRPPMFLLDETRLAAYSDDGKQFDNRYVARLPSGKALEELGLDRILYVTRDFASGRESADLNEDFVWAKSLGIDVRALALDTFGPDATATADAAAPETTRSDAGAEAATVALAPDTPRHFYARRAQSDGWFFHDYPWAKVATGAAEPTLARSAVSYSPTPMVSPYSSGRTREPTHTTPPSFGMVPVVVALGTGAILGAKMSRSGSWTRATSGFGGG